MARIDPPFQDPGSKVRSMDVARATRGWKASMVPRVRARYSPWHSRFVSMMKFLLPSAAAVLIILVIVWPYLQATDSRFRIGFAALRTGDAEDPAMINPRYMGTDKSDQPFSITADLAKNLLNESATVELEMPKADITLEDGTWLVLTAETGVYARDSKTLELVGAVTLFHDSGYEFKTSKAHIDLAAGAAAGDQPVEGQGPFGTLQAEGFRLIDKGKVIHFTGKSRMVLYNGVGKLVP